MLNRRVLRIALAERNLTLKEVARLTGLDLLRVYRITSKNVRPRVQEVKLLAAVLGVSPGALEVDRQ